MGECRVLVFSGLKTRKPLILALLCLLLLGAVLLNAYKFGHNAFAQGDYKAARGWYQVAAHMGHGKAQNNLAGLYAEGLGGEQDNTLAAKVV